MGKDMWRTQSKVSRNGENQTWEDCLRRWGEESNYVFQNEIYCHANSNFTSDFCTGTASKYVESCSFWVDKCRERLIASANTTRFHSYLCSRLNNPILKLWGSWQVASFESSFFHSFHLLSLGKIRDMTSFVERTEGLIDELEQAELDKEALRVCDYVLQSYHFNNSSSRNSLCNAKGHTTLRSFQGHIFFYLSQGESEKNLSTCWGRNALWGLNGKKGRGERHGENGIKEERS